MIDLRRHPTASSWLADCGAELEADEARNSLILGAAIADHGGSPPPYLAVVRDRAGGLAAAALMISPARMVLSGSGPCDDVLDALCADVAASGVRMETLNAPDPLAERFAERWSRLTGEPGTVAMRQRLHALTTVSPVPEPPGRMRFAGPADLDRVAEWIAAFERDALGSADAAATRAQAERRIAKAEMVLWEDGGPRCMAARARRTRHTETVNHVYTPPAGRGRGYATALVAALSRRLLEDGSRQCLLYTDLANPTSNAIYARIGYRPIGDFSMVSFGAVGP